MVGPMLTQPCVQVPRVVEGVGIAEVGLREVAVRRGGGVLEHRHGKTVQVTERSFKGQSNDRSENPPGTIVTRPVGTTGPSHGARRQGGT